MKGRRNICSKSKEKHCAEAKFLGRFLMLQLLQKQHSAIVLAQEGQRVNMQWKCNTKVRKEDSKALCWHRKMDVMKSCTEMSLSSVKVHIRYLPLGRSDFQNDCFYHIA